MNSQIKSISTSKVGNSDLVAFAYCTTDSIKVGFRSPDINTGVWLARDQAIELIDILTKMVHSEEGQGPQ